MTAKDFLKQYEIADRAARRYRREYMEELLAIDTVRSLSDLDGLPHGSGISNPVEAKAVRLADKAELYKDAYLEAIRIRQEVFDVIAKIPNGIGDVMYERYINLRKWHEVAEIVHYSERQCRKLHNKGLRIVEEFLEVPL